MRIHRFHIIFTLFIISFSLNAQKNYIKKVYFDKDSYEINSENSIIIQFLCKKIKNKKPYFVKLDAHTDSDGTEIYNDTLATKRAISVYNKLIECGFSKENIEISSFGERRPVVKNDSEENMQKNRRVRMIFINTKDKIRIQGKILSDADKSELADAKILIKTEEKLTELYTNDKGEYDIWVPKHNPSYYLVSKVKNHFYHFEKIDTESYKGKVMQLDIELKKLTPGSTIKIPLFNFIAEQDVLIQESVPNLALLLGTMRQNPNLKIEIHGHINKQKVGPVDENSASFQLSVRRAKMVYNYLLEHKIDPSRMEIKAFGNWHMLYPDTDDIELQDLNRRVEIYIVDN
ncbi:MAG: OmpA family protein [Flavobacteriales bacterium]|nr:OmpA family protein [Flavobacteriales bacterium]